MMRSVCTIGLTLAAFLGVNLSAAAGGAEAPAAKPLKSEWNVRHHLPLHEFTVQAHRGAGELAEENTIHAFEIGWSLNCIPEADIRTTRDGVIVAFHDAEFSRVVKDVPPELANKGVTDVTFAELQKLDVGAWKGDRFEGRRVSRLSEVFAVMRGKPERKLYLDIKQVDLAKLAAEVKQAGVEKQVILASTKYEQDIRGWKKLLPDGQTLFWIGGSPEQQTKKLEEARSTGFADITQVQIHVRMPEGIDRVQRDDVDPFVQSDEFLISAGELLREHDILYQSLPWDGATKDVYWKLLDLGLMSFATDHPKVTWEAIEAYYSDAEAEQ